MSESSNNEKDNRQTEKPASVTATTVAEYFNTHECFEFRLLREMRLVDFRKRIKAIKKSSKVTDLAAKKEAQKEFGITTLEQERKYLADWLTEMQANAAAASASERQRRHRQKMRNQPFESAIADLPPTASPSVEMDWVKSHPAMTRKDRQKDTGDKILITPDDILKAPNGKCPSRSAAQMLQHYANKPDAFFKELLSETKKAKSQEDEVEAEKRAIKTNSEISEMLAALFPEATQ